MFYLLFDVGQSKQPFSMFRYTGGDTRVIFPEYFCMLLLTLYDLTAILKIRYVIS